MRLHGIPARSIPRRAAPRGAWALLALLALLLAACSAGGGAGTTSSGRAPTTPADEVLYVLDGAPGAAAGGAQHIVAFHPGGAALRTLPAGLVSRDHRRLYSAAAAGGATTLRVIDTTTGAALRSATLPGAYATDHAGFADAVLTPDGRWLALRAQGAPAGTTRIALVDTQSGALAKTINLPGSFELDAIAPDGALLYLLEYPGGADHHYYVRAYDVAAGDLVGGAIVDKTEPDENMNGSALARVMAPDGSAAYTLYIDTGRNIAFIHELPLANQGSGPFFARCIDLPHGASGALLPDYTLALSPDGKTLYAVNAALGLASGIAVHPSAPSGDQITISARFGAAPGAVAANTPRDTSGMAALARDGRTLYVAGPRGVWALETAGLRLQRGYLADRAFTGLAASVDGRTLYAAAPDSGITLLDLTTGQAPAPLRTPAESPWSIAWMTNS